MDPPASGRRGRKRARVSEAETSPNQQQQQQQQQQHNPAVWTQDATVRGTDHDTASQQHPTYTSQHVDVSRLSSQVAVTDANGLMNGYATASHSQYPNTSPPVTHAPGDVHSLPSVQTPQPQQSQQRRNNDNRMVYFNGNPTPSTTSIAEAASAAVSPAPNRSYGLSNLVASWQASPMQNSESTPTNTMNTSNTAAADTSIMSQAQDQSPATTYHQMQVPQGAIYETFEDLLKTVQAAAKEQGFGIVKLRASNYRNNKATRYDLVCDRGGVKYNSTAKKRNPSTRKIDCPWKAKAVCEVQLNNQWRFSVQEAHHNHEPRVAVPAPGQGADSGTPVNQSLRTIVNKIDRMNHDVNANLARVEQSIDLRFEGLEKRLESLEALIRSNVLAAAGGTPNMGGQSMPTANMGGAALGSNGLANGGMSNGGMGSNMGNGMGGAMGNGMGSGMGSGGMGNGMVDSRMSNLESRVSGLEQVGGMDMSLMDDDPSSRRMPLL
ncbi:hypothetical protein NKR19_g1881 [Coniochaeta hoffmannii]|uniref:FAR1 domain-containing protein n=1 Tax=Coniochaeta hoffmannii TaxID=91930 RepID=A0AA38VSP0_9PEZI|nr:hypothetical protein NKR19_g1881 [Coniochaeta hoffmannii]